jgi:hypothetical protein
MEFAMRCSLHLLLLLGSAALAHGVLAQDDPTNPLEQPPDSEGAGEETDASGDPEPPLHDAAAAIDLAALTAELTTLMDDLVQARSRIAVLGRQLFQTKVQIKVHSRTDDDFRLNAMTIRLDGAPVFTADGSRPLADDAEPVFDGFAAPGPHILTVQVEHRSSTSDTYRYVLRDSYHFEVLRGRITELLVVLDGDSSIAEEFADDEEGEYDVRTRLRVATRALGEP